MKFSGWEPWPIEMRDASLNPMGTGRPAGLHLGGVIHRIAESIDPDSLKDVPGDQSGARMVEGFLWEVALEYVACGMPLDEALDTAFKRYMIACRTGVAKQVSIKKDGIWMTPDALVPDKGEIESYKSTRRSLKGAVTAEEFENNFWKWMMAEKAYCLALSVDTCRFIVLWHSGDYSKGVGSAPQVLQCECVWTPEELTQNWRAILNVAKKMPEWREE